MELLVLPGDGIGPEIVAAAIRVLQTVNEKYDLSIDLDYDDVGFTSLEKHGTTLRDELLQRAKSYDGIILGPQSHMDYPPPAEGGINISASFRVKLDLYANIRPARARDFLERGAPGMDLVIVRELTEGFYADRNMYKGWAELMPTEDMAISLRKITRQACERIARRAFEVAEERRQKVTAVHKANCFHITCGLFLEEVRKVAAEYPHVMLEEQIVDATAALLVRDPTQFDVLVTTNLFGDILSDLASELSGSIGLAGALMAGDNLAAAQAQHGSAPDIAGQNVANPTSMILSVAMLVEWLGKRKSDDRLLNAGKEMVESVDRVLADPTLRTRDIGGSAHTDEFATHVASNIQKAQSREA
ncbi:MAG: isocitrate/isopropylmalate dehydrogenase family protein [Chloroflexota bacterium]